MTSLPLRPLVVLLLSATGACTGIPRGITAVSPFDAGRYSGTWYEIARLDHSFERGLEDVTATYIPEPDGTLRVVNRGFDTSGDRWKEIKGKAKLAGAPDVGQLKVSFFGPFQAGYNVVELDPGYSHALVVGNNRSYLWILARSPDLPEATYARLVAQASGLGFDTDRLIRVSHSRR